MSDDETPELPMPRSAQEADRMLSDARMVLQVQRSSRGSIVGLHRIRTTIDRLLDARNRLTGPPVCMSVPYGQTVPCGRVKSRFGSSVYLCGSCDFTICQNANCDRRVLALDADTCNPCRRVPYSPWPPR